MQAHVSAHVYIEFCESSTAVQSLTYMADEILNGGWRTPERVLKRGAHLRGGYYACTGFAPQKKDISSLSSRFMYERDKILLVFRGKVSPIPVVQLIA